jgi:hypothetical protein
MLSRLVLLARESHLLAALLHQGEQRVGRFAAMGGGRRRVAPARELPAPLHRARPRAGAVDAS